MKGIIAVLVALVLLFAGNVQAKAPDLTKLKPADMAILKKTVGDIILLAVKEIADDVCLHDVRFLNKRSEEGSLQILGDNMVMEFKLWDGLMASGTVEVHCLGGELYQFRSKFQLYGDPAVEDHIFLGKLR